MRHKFNISDQLSHDVKMLGSIKNWPWLSHHVSRRLQSNPLDRAHLTQEHTHETSTFLLPPAVAQLLGRLAHAVPNLNI